MGRDGVLVDASQFAFLEDHLTFAPGAIEAVRRLNAHGYLVIVVTNQPGVAQGLFTEAQMRAFNALLIRRMAARGAMIAAICACPHHPQARLDAYRHPDHPDRKPNPGLILAAAERHGVDLSRSFLIGRRASDMEAARRAGLPGFRLDGGDLDLAVRDLLGT